MTALKKNIKIHIKNNRWKEGSFPNTPEGEKVFTITEERVKKALNNFPHLEGRFETFIDWDEDNFIKSMATSDILLTWNLPTSNIDQIAPNLCWIHCIGAGVEHLSPFDWLPDNVALTNNKGIHAKKAGEYGLMTILMMHNHFPEILTNQKNKLYKSIYGTPIAGQTIVILGTGSLGSSVAQLLEPLGAKVIGVNRQGNLVQGCSKTVTSDNLDDILPHADILYIALPETPETINIIDRRRLGLLKKSCGIINVGRQSAIDYVALSEMLETKKLASAILDVFSPEPIATSSKLWKIPNLVITPHISADDGTSYVSQTLEFFFRNFECFISEKPLLNLVNKNLGY
jgi:phosphoglycerate dehydrogenase-like enzyme